MSDDDWDRQLRAIGMMVLAVMDKAHRLTITHTGATWNAQARVGSRRERGQSSRSLADALEHVVRGMESWRRSEEC